MKECYNNYKVDVLKFKQTSLFRLLQAISLLVSIIILAYGFVFALAYFPSEIVEKLIIECKTSGEIYEYEDMDILARVSSDNFRSDTEQFCAVNYNLNEFIETVINNPKIKKEAPALYLDKERVEELLSYKNLIPGEKYVKHHFLINERDFMLEKWINPLIQQLPREWREFDTNIIKETEGSWFEAGKNFLVFVTIALFIQKIIETTVFYILFGKIMPNFLFSKKAKNKKIKNSLTI